MARVGERNVLYFKETEMGTQEDRACIAKILEAAKNIVVTQEDVAAMHERLREDIKKSEDADRTRAVGKEWFNSLYTI